MSRHVYLVGYGERGEGYQVTHAFDTLIAAKRHVIDNDDLWPKQTNSSTWLATKPNQVDQVWIVKLYVRTPAPAEPPAG